MSAYAPLTPLTGKIAGEWSLTNPDTDVEWTYKLLIQSVDTKSERRVGELHAVGLDLSKAERGDYLTTPWGRAIFWDTYYEKGWLFLGSHNCALDPCGKEIPVLATLLDQNGTWSSAVDTTSWQVKAHALGSKSEARHGDLREKGIEEHGTHVGEERETPWGTLTWFGLSATYGGRGWLLVGAYDAPFQP